MRRQSFSKLSLSDLRVDHGDDPLLQFPLLKMVEFSMVSTLALLSSINEARGTCKEHGNVDALTASMKRGWDIGSWPFANVFSDFILESLPLRTREASSVVGLN